MTHLCSLIGKYPTFLSCVRNGTDRISRDDLSIIALVLNTSVAYLTNETDDPTSATIHSPRMGYLTRVLQTLTPSDFEKVERLAEDLLYSRSKDTLLPSDTDFAWELSKILIELSDQQRIDIMSLAHDVAGEMIAEDSNYAPLSEDKRDFIVHIATMQGDINGEKRRALDSVLLTSDEELMDEQELITAYRQLSKSGRRQLMGKAYELLDGQAAPKSGNEVSPPDIDLVSTVLDRGIKK